MAMGDGTENEMFWLWICREIVPIGEINISNMDHVNDFKIIN